MVALISVFLGWLLGVGTTTIRDWSVARKEMRAVEDEVTEILERLEGHERTLEKSILCLREKSRTTVFPQRIDTTVFETFYYKHYHRFNKKKRHQLKEFYGNVMTYNASLDEDHGDTETHFMTILPSYWIAKAVGEILITRGDEVTEEHPAMVAANEKVRSMNQRLHADSSQL